MTHRCEHNEIDVAVFELNPIMTTNMGMRFLAAKKLLIFFLMIKYNFSTIQYRTQSY